MWLGDKATEFLILCNIKFDVTDYIQLMAAVVGRPALGDTSRAGSLEGKALVLCKTGGGPKVKCSLEDQGDEADLVQVWHRRKWSLDMRERRGDATEKAPFICDVIWKPFT